MLRIVLCTHAAPITPVDRWRALIDSLARLLAGFPRHTAGSASTTLLSGPAQASLTLRPARLLDLLSRPLSQGLAVAVTRLPSSGFSAPDSYRGVPTELLGRDFHPLERCTLMAHRMIMTISGSREAVNGYDELTARAPLAGHRTFPDCDAPVSVGGGLLAVICAAHQFSR